MENLNLDKIASECLIATDNDCAIVIKNLENLKQQYSDIELIAIFNYFLSIEYNSDVLCWLIRAVNKFRDSSSGEYLTNLLLLKNEELFERNGKEYYNNVRVLCAKALSNLKNPMSVHPLMQCLNNKDEYYKVRLSCADALGRLGNKYAVTTLMDVVSDEEEKSVYIRESAAEALGLIGDMRAVDSLVKILESKNGIMDKFTYLKEKAVEALCRLSPTSDRAFKALKSALNDENPQIRINSIEALLDYNTKEADDLIRGMLNDPDEEVQKNAVIAVYNIDGEEGMRAIINSSDTSQICKDEARNLLEHIEDYD